MRDKASPGGLACRARVQAGAAREFTSPPSAGSDMLVRLHHHHQQLTHGPTRPWCDERRCARPDGAGAAAAAAAHVRQDVCAQRVADRAAGVHPRRLVPPRVGLAHRLGGHHQALQPLLTPLLHCLARHHAHLCAAGCHRRAGHAFLRRRRPAAAPAHGGLAGHRHLLDQRRRQHCRAGGQGARAHHPGRVPHRAGRRGLQHHVHWPDQSRREGPCL